MKKLTTILLAFFSLALTCQEPDTLLYFTPNYVDSLNARINYLEALQIENGMVLKYDTLNITIIGSGVSIYIDKKGAEVDIRTRQGINLIEL